MNTFPFTCVVWYNSHLPLPQIAIAIYVFCKSWTGWFHDQRLLRAAILLFVPGVVKCLEKPLALRNATVNSIANSSDPTMEVSIEEDDGTLPTAMDSLEEFVAAANRCVEEEANRNLPCSSTTR